jgi:tRNA dimethylallyltransferase
MPVETHTKSLIPLVVIAGPTATGKTALALALAERLCTNWESEVISADARQIYHLMDIATAKPTPAERARLSHHLLDVVWPDETLTLAEYQRMANAAIADVWTRGRLPMLVGGAGLYIRAVANGLAIPEVAPQPTLRAELEALLEAEGVAALHARLAALDPVTATRIDARNPRRLIRALEVCLITGRPFSEQLGARPTPYRPLLFGLNMERDALYARADARIDTMRAAGLVAETEALLARGYSWELPAMSSLGYREVGAYLRGETTLDEAFTRFKQATHGYIRRQLTWFRRDERIVWLDALLPPETLADQVAARLLPWLDV